MKNEKLINQICTIQRGLGIIEGVASGLPIDRKSRPLWWNTLGGGRYDSVIIIIPVRRNVK